MATDEHRWMAPSPICIRCGPLCSSVVLFVLLQDLDANVLEVDLRPFRLEAEGPFGQIELAARHRDAIDLARRLAVLDGGFGGVPFADLVACFFEIGRAS